MRIQRFADEPTEGILVCERCNLDEREINVYERGEGTFCVDCLEEWENKMNDTEEEPSQCIHPGCEKNPPITIEIELGRLTHTFHSCLEHFEFAKAFSDQLLK